MSERLGTGGLDVKLSTALILRRMGAALSVTMFLVQCCSFYLHLFVLPTISLPFLLVATLLPALLGISAYNRALKAEETKAQQADLT
jgi:hypothetical protein